LVLELPGRVGDVSPSLASELDLEGGEGPFVMERMLETLPPSDSGWGLRGELGVVELSDGELEADQFMGVAWFLDDRLRLLSISSKTMAMISSAGSSIPPRRMTKLLSLSASWSHP